MGYNLTAPIPTATGKQPKARKQTKAQNRMGWDNINQSHPRKETKNFKANLTNQKINRKNVNLN